MHGQVVLCPGLNDGEHLERTIDDLLNFYPSVASLAIVPVGLTQYRNTLPKLTPFTPVIARKNLAPFSPIQTNLRRRIGTPFAFLGDEIYIMAGAQVPPASHYAGFPQIENGVGMVRTFLTQFNAALRSRAGTHQAKRGTICTGKIFYPYLKSCVDRLGLDLKTIAIESLFCGPGSGVACLLRGSGVIAALKGSVYGDFAVLPSESMIGDDYLFLDDLTIKDVEREIGVAVLPSGYDPRDFVRMLRGREF